MPAARPWSMGRANLQATWPWYLGGFVVLTVAIPRAAIAALNAPVVGAALVMVLGVTAFALARTGRATTEDGLESEPDAAAPRLDL